MATKIVILEQCEVAPSPGGPAEKWLPLLDFDVTFLRFSLMQILMFYELQCSKAYFLETIVPNLKNSLSLALNHFSPLAGNTTLPLTSGTPFTHYVAGDSVSLTIAQSDADFVHLTGNHYRYSPISNYFYFLVVNKDYYFIFRRNKVLTRPFNLDFQIYTSHSYLFSLSY